MPVCKAQEQAEGRNEGWRGSISRLLTHRNVTKPSKRTDRCPGGSWKQSQPSSNIRPGYSRLVRWHHSLAMGADCTRGERVMTMLLIALMMLVITITDDYNSAAYPVPGA